MIETAGPQTRVSPVSLAEAAHAWRSGRFVEAERLCRELLARDPNFVDGHRLLQELLISGHRLREAIVAARTVARLAPRDAAAHRGLANLLISQGDVAAAIIQFERSLDLEPRNVRALNNLGNLKSGQGDIAAAIRLLERAIAIQPDYAVAHANLGLTLARADRLEEAARRLRGALALNPLLHEAWLNLAGVFQRMNQPEDALLCYDRAAALRAPDVQSLVCRAEVLLVLRRPDEALNTCDRVLTGVSAYATPRGVVGLRAAALLSLDRLSEAMTAAQAAVAEDPGDAQACVTLGFASLRSGALTDALGAFDRAIRLLPGLAKAHAGRAHALEAMGRVDQAIDAYHEAANLDPADASVYLRSGLMMLRLGSGASALDAFERILALDPDNVAALEARSRALVALGRHEAALNAFKDLEERAPSLHYLSGYRFSMQLSCCDWSGYERLRREIEARVLRRERVDVPLNFLAHSDSPEGQRVCAEVYAAAECKGDPHRFAGAYRCRPTRLRIGYLSFDFRNHPVAQLTARLFELHDRTRFETHGFCAAVNDGSDLRRRLETAFDRFEDVSALSDEDVAARVAERQIDILVDLGGHTLGSRTRALAFRPAPVQISFLGYAGTIGADFIDYIVADRHVIPESERAHYAEQVIYMPDSYLPGDPAAPLAAVDKRSAGLPEDAFVMCAFNAPYKFTPTVFAQWLNLLIDIPSAVLWLREAPQCVKRNLAAAAAGRGVDPARLIYAPRVPTVADHLHRLAAADVFVDTFPYNAHTTAREALSAAVPVITLRGRTFVSRVATSLLHAVGLAQLSVDHPGEYRRLAIELARSPEALERLKSHLREARATSPLFDVVRYCRHLESAYVEAAARHGRGERPSPLAVDVLR